MKAKFLVTALAACLILLNLCFSPAAYGGARIDITVEHGVEKEAEAQARLAVSTILDFFQRTYGIGLEKDIRVLLVPDKSNYKQAIKQWYGASEAMAVVQSEMSAGLQSKGTIIVNLGTIHNSKSQVFCLCHEIVHHYQYQESRGKYGSIRWITEGVADAIAAHILETAGIKSPGSYKKRWQEILQKAQSWPKLEKLHSGQEWYAAMGAYGGIPYRTASLAVLTLIEWRGYRQLFTYFQALRQTSPEDAFYQAFGARLDDFEKQFRPF